MSGQQTAANKTPKKCKGCRFRAMSYGESTCDFFIKTGKLRNCPVEECPYYEKEKEGKRNGP